MTNVHTAAEPLVTTTNDGLDERETWSRDRLEEFQLEKLKWSVRHAYENAPMYREKFDDAGVHPDDIREMSDLAKFPFTTKEDLRRAYPFGMFAKPLSEIPRIHASSGTTGRPTVVGYTHNDLDAWATVVARSMRLSGVRPGDMVHNAYGYGLFTGGLGAHAGAEKLGCTVIPMSGGQTDRQVQVIRDFKPRVICCTPSYLLTVMDAMRDMGLDPADSSLEIAILGAEPWTEPMRQEIEKGLGLKATDIYGLSEVTGPGVSGESVDHQQGSTVWEDYFYPEIVDPDDLSRTMPDGEQGELVFTTLQKEALPIIRYRTKDLSVLLPGDARPAFRRMQKITGRTDDMIILRGVNLFPTQIEEIAVEIEHLTPHFILELHRKGRMDSLTVKIESVPGVPQEDITGAAQLLRRLIKNRIGSTVDVETVEPGTLPRSQGKYKRVYDYRMDEADLTRS
ncbi:MULTISPECIES: phenylacetate--CoA ligase PaaK [Helcobacillus]|uniref:Phenylacetate-coenzyme A ligase n=1 Tax=Helcobacillus massiliensis TaxID=521392 RepID=A0A839QV81_9MICO|nr:MULTISPECIES: phenylacetate--CoA ligase PaaK [Helcobacillus]MBB3023635.1 phenylacetate-CoA ligase [Helcobacillus massiliensis]MCG7427838.1 phenylacetate--CoA ligase [Helcobacillus sp. ACRRO]MDK7741612.1 phenylacetate--CoA ligase [Helcobacillus massiliensis]WOO92658.1 phenylacetate--CoA ligase PaaK [Helcobacillus massiliensis]